MGGKRAQGDCSSEPQAGSYHMCFCFRILTLHVDLPPSPPRACGDQPGRLLCLLCRG